MSVWPEVALGDVCSAVGGGTPKRTNPDFYGADVPWVTPKDMKRWNIANSQVGLTDLGLESSAARLVPSGSVLIVVRSGVLKHTLPVGLARVPLAINQDMKALLCGSHVHPDYLARYLKWMSPTILQWVRATTADNFSIDKLKQLQVPLPPLPEQRRIAAILDHADALRAKRREVLARLDELTQSIFIDMFGDPVANTRHWSSATLKAAGVQFASGLSIVARTGDEHPINRILKVSAVSSGTFRPNHAKPLPLDYAPPESHEVRAGDLLLTRASGSVDLICVAAAVDHVPDGTYLPDKLWKVQLDADTKIHPAYVHQLFKQPGFRAFVAHTSSGASGVRNISQAKVLSFESGLPPLQLQDAFATRTSEVSGLVKQCEIAVSKLDALFGSLQSRAFRGGL